ncbi:uncharacterized protein PSFLO_05132 [Pseudozyma flocculosa]|uniref:BHLH domain-containing protein n=1 Tax=Pseudozyma flocculosa TaxID=84751 RepID=A0A5C3F8H2_9BASI|nr:uncharacterized protein PSFLO_05132 [Pseudozyma flocculosa]
MSYPLLGHYHHPHPAAIAAPGYALEPHRGSFAGHSSTSTSTSTSSVSAGSSSMGGHLATALVGDRIEYKAYVALSGVGRDRALKGGEKESKKMKTELTKYLADHAPAFRQLKGKVMFVDSIPRAQDGAVLKRALAEKGAATAAQPVAGPSKGFFNTVLTSPAQPASVPATATAAVDAATADDAGVEDGADGSPKKSGRDSKRRATHSQIERRRREKINDRLVTLRSIVPACAKELEDRRRQRQEEEEEAARIAAGGAPKTLIDAATGKPKRKRNRKKPEPKKAGDNDKDEELGLHKLEVLTHAINHIFELKARIEELETGKKPTWIPTADNPFGVEGAPVPSSSAEVAAAATSARSSVSQTADPTRSIVGETKEEGREARANAGHDEDGDASGLDDDDDGDDELADEGQQPMAKRRTSTATRPASIRPAVQRGAASSSARGRRAHGSSSSSRDSDETSPIMSLGHNTPLLISPATTAMTTMSSPMMSLSAESPILLGDMGSKRTDKAYGFQPLPPAALPLSSHGPMPSTGAAAASATAPTPGDPQRRDSSSFLFKQLSLKSPNFVPFNPLAYSAASRARTSTASVTPYSSYGAESGMRETRSPRSSETAISSSGNTPSPSRRDAGDVEASSGAPDGSAGHADHRAVPGLADSDTSAAALLLNFSTSPEVMRPVSSVRASSQTRVGARPTDLSSSYDLGSSAGHRHPLYFTSPQFRPIHSTSSSSFRDDPLRRVPGSAPGGARPMTTNFDPFGRRTAVEFRRGYAHGGAAGAADEVRGVEDEDEGDELLNSPPHLALDGALEGEEGDEPAAEAREDDVLSDNTVEDVARVPMQID